MAVVTAAVMAAGPDTVTPLSQVERYDYVVGTQVIGQVYRKQPATEPLLIDGAHQILAMGSNIIKFSMSSRYAENGYAAKRDPKIKSLSELARIDPSYRRVFGMPFAYYLIWTYPFSTDGRIFPWHGHMKPDVLADEYREMYNFTKYLLTTFSGSGKTFLLGNWEGDWHLLNGTTGPAPWENDPAEDAPIGMIDWASTRQKAVADARRDTPHRDVRVFFYVEANLVQKSIRQGRVTVSSAVLSAVNPDFVSYSSYDSTNPDKDLHRDLPAALNNMESKLKPKPGVSGKRVFVGEYTSTPPDFTPAKQDERMRDIVATSIRWGTPFVLYWELYSNEAVDGKPRPYWLIDDHGVKQPVYETCRHYNAAAREFVEAYVKQKGRVPNTAEFQAFALKWFTAPAKSK